MSGSFPPSSLPLNGPIAFCLMTKTPAPCTIPSGRNTCTHMVDGHQARYKIDTTASCKPSQAKSNWPGRLKAKAAHQHSQHNHDDYRDHDPGARFLRGRRRSFRVRNHFGGHPLPVYNPPTIGFARFVLSLLVSAPPSFVALVSHLVRWIGERLVPSRWLRYRDCQGLLARVSLCPQRQS